MEKEREVEGEGGRVRGRRGRVRRRRGRVRGRRGRLRGRRRERVEREGKGGERGVEVFISRCATY